MNKTNKKVWIDLDNSPHVLYLKPFVKIAREKGFVVVLTARNLPEIVELCRLHGLEAGYTGKRTPKNRILKVFATIMRALTLYFYIRRKEIAFSVSNSRSCAIASVLLGVKSFIITDFEYADMRVYTKMGSYLVVPSVIPVESFEEQGIPHSRLLRFQGMKEHFYLKNNYPFLEREQLGLPINSDEIIAVVRPECWNAHYQTKKTSDLERKLWQVFSRMKGIYFIIVPRDEEQRVKMKKLVSELSLNAFVLESALDGPSLLRIADLVFCGGGTMARESATLGTPAYSYFCGKMCAVDEYLIRKGSLTSLKTEENLATIRWEKKKNRQKLPANKVQSDLVESLWDKISTYTS